MAASNQEVLLALAHRNRLVVLALLQVEENESIENENERSFGILHHVTSSEYQLSLVVCARCTRNAKETYGTFIPPSTKREWRAVFGLKYSGCDLL